MWRTVVFAGQRLIHRCLGCGQRGYNPQSASTVVDRGPVVHRCPPAIHRMSTGLVPGPGDNARTSAARPPQNLQQPIHIRPQDVDGDMTVGTCPHRFPQRLSTSVRSSPDACPPFGDNSWVWPVDNVGTTIPSPRRVAALAKGRGPWSGMSCHGGPAVLRPISPAGANGPAVTRTFAGRRGCPYIPGPLSRTSKMETRPTCSA